MHTLVALFVVVMAINAQTHSAAKKTRSKLCECPKPKQRRMFTLSINPKGEKCLKFQYRIKPVDRNLTVALKIDGVIGAPILSAAGGSGRDWKSATVEISQRRKKYTIVFDGVRHANRKGPVAIRDLTVHDGICTEHSCLPDQCNLRRRQACFNDNEVFRQRVFGLMRNCTCHVRIIRGKPKPKIVCDEKTVE